MKKAVLVAMTTFTVFMGLIVPDNSFAYIDFGADLSYYKNKSDVAGVKATTSTFAQNYSLGFHKTITRTLSLSGNLQWLVLETDSERKTSIYPILMLNFTPPAMYDLRFSYNRTETLPSEGDHIANSNMSVSFTLPTEKWPSLALTLNRSTSEDMDAPKNLDTVSTFIAANSGYAFKFMDIPTSVNYSFNHSTTEDRIGGTTSKSPSHHLSASLSRSFLDRKVGTSANLGYETTTTTSESMSGPRRFDFLLGPSAGLSVQSATPLLVTLAAEPELIDNDTTTAVTPTIDLTTAYWNIGVGFLSAETVHSLYVYITTTTAEESNIVNGLYNFGWQLYSSPDNITWTPHGSLVPVYNSFFNRFEFSFSEISARYFKVVNTTGQGISVRVTEIQASAFFLSTPTETFSYTTTHEFGGFNVSYTPTRRLNAGFTLNYDHSLREAGGVSNNDVTGVGYGFNLQYVFFPRYLTASTSYSSSTSSSTQALKGTTTSGSAGYSLSLSSSPLDTVNGNFSYSHGQSTADGTVTSTSNSVGTAVSMRLYTGVDLNLSTTFATSESPEQNATSESRSYYWSFRLVPWQSLTAMVNGSNSESSNNSGGASTSSTSESLNMNFSYTPTRKIYLSGSMNIKPQVSQGLSVSWLPTRQVQIGTRLNKSTGTTGMGWDFSWQPFGRLSFRMGYDATTSGNGKNQSFFARTSIRF
ncbi:MAG: hypothetical protein HY890_07170 [Deltaproteobacteria bacterium]|nr:hypothetical protein [Deltaproteobacteria bacterium]